MLIRAYGTNGKGYHNDPSSFSVIESLWSGCLHLQPACPGKVHHLLEALAAAAPHLLTKLGPLWPRLESGSIVGLAELKDNDDNDNED